ncbi:MAG TPA: hypothetical protein VFG07_09485 [Thermoplasmata archaeon]|nr:hypothetical protein [Thermoplasmata archaeon]
MTGAMLTTTNAVVLSRSNVEHDLRASLYLLAAGIVLYAAFVLLLYTGVISTEGGNYGNAVVVSMLVQGTGALFILVGGLFAAINWALLRRPTRGGAR